MLTVKKPKLDGEVCSRGTISTGLTSLSNRGSMRKTVSTDPHGTHDDSTEVEERGDATQLIPPTYEMPEYNTFETIDVDRESYISGASRESNMTIIPAHQGFMAPFGPPPTRASSLDRLSTVTEDAEVPERDNATLIPENLRLTSHSLMLDEIGRSQRLSFASSASPSLTAESKQKKKSVYTAVTELCNEQGVAQNENAKMLILRTLMREESHAGTRQGYREPIGRPSFQSSPSGAYVPYDGVYSGSPQLAGTDEAYGFEREFCVPAGKKEVQSSPSREPVAPTLLIAAAIGAVDVVSEILSEYKFTINDSFHTHPVTQDTPLMWAAKRGNRQICTLLLESRADINAANQWGWTPLLSATEKGHLEVVRMILNHSGTTVEDTINAQDKSGNSPLLAAVACGDRDVIKLLIDAKADVNLANYRDQTPLYHAVRKLRVDLVCYLLSLNADTNKCDTSGNSPLMVTCRRKLRSHEGVKGQDDTSFTKFQQSQMDFIIESLLNNKADVNLKNKQEENAFALAKRRGNYHTLEMLYKYAALTPSSRPIYSACSEC